MGFYSQVIFPRFLDWAMSDPTLADYRQEVLAEVSGEVLEIGFGTGLNLSHYPKNIAKLTTIDANPGMSNLAKKRIEASPLKVENLVLNGESLPMADHSFDSVVSTWTLCSIAKVDQALAEISRVLKSGGKFFFIEHGLSKDPNIQVWQHRLTPLQKIWADGCHLDRNIKHLVENNLEILKLEQFNIPSFPQILGYTYKGVAIKI
ncbi:MAG: class I SAM-dependent methyltransferase [Coleofasciculaceae cyanobacterium]